MQLCLVALVFPHLFTSVLSSTVPINPALNLARASSNATLVKNATSKNPVGATRIRCNGDIYRRGLGERSCISALEQIDDADEYLSFGTRGGPIHFQVDLPRRWISGMNCFLARCGNQSLCS